MSDRKPNKREERALNGLQMADDGILDAYACGDAYEAARAAKPTLEEILEIGEGQLLDR